MSKISTLAATLALAAASALALPAAAQSYDGRGNDHHERSRDHDRDRGDDRRDHRHRDDDRRHGDRDRDDRDRYARYGRDDHREPRYSAPRYAAPRYVPPRVVYRPAYTYVAPRGYAVQRWRVGSRMPAPFYVSQYYVDPYAYQLRIPPRGYHWVRVDRDVYLVSAMSGLVADVLYGVFR